MTRGTRERKLGYHREQVELVYSYQQRILRLKAVEAMAFSRQGKGSKAAEQAGRAIENLMAKERRAGIRMRRASDDLFGDRIRLDSQASEA